ncbi:MAG: FAD-binding oxidoreductase [Syntrophales bacterium]
MKTILDETRVSTGESVKKLHSRDESYHTPVLPDVVVWPHSTEEVARLVRWAYGRKIPITPWGAGTSLEGNPMPVKGGLVIDFEQMQQMLAVHPEDFQVDVQAGVIYKELNKMLGKHGLFFLRTRELQRLSEA